MVAGGAVTHAPEDFPAQDVGLCAESLCLVEKSSVKTPEGDFPKKVEPRPERAINAERYLRDPSEAAELYRDRPELLANTHRVAERCDEDVLPSRTRLPQVWTTQALLHEATYAGDI